MTYLKRMRDLREDHDKTQKDIADVLGTSQTMYARYERGANELHVRHFLTLCDYTRFLRITFWVGRTIRSRTSEYKRKTARAVFCLHYWFCL